MGGGGWNKAFSLACGYEPPCLFLEFFFLEEWAVGAGAPVAVGMAKLKEVARGAGAAPGDRKEVGAAAPGVANPKDGMPGVVAGAVKEGNMDVAAGVVVVASPGNAGDAKDGSKVCADVAAGCPYGVDGAMNMVVLAPVAGRMATGGRFCSVPASLIAGSKGSVSAALRPWRLPSPPPSASRDRRRARYSRRSRSTDS